LDVSLNTLLESLDCTSNPLTCVKVNQTQLDNDVSDWNKDDSSEWSLDCNES